MSDALAVRPAAGPTGWRLGRLPDERLVARVRAGDDRAFEALFERHHRPLLSFCRHMLGQADEAEDAVQQTFIRALAALRRDDRPVQLKAWLYGIARNRCLTILGRRRELPGEAGEVEVATEGLADEVQRRDDLRALLGDLRRLPTDQRAALLLAELGSHSHDEVAAILACPHDKVKALVFQAREALIAQRQARDTSCAAIRATLATARGAELRRAALRRHLRDCAGCREFKSAVAEQRSALALLLPVAPSAAFGLWGASAASGAAAAGVGLGGASASSAAAAGAGLGTAAAATGPAAAEGLGTTALTGGAKALAAKALVAATLVGATGAATGSLPGVPPGPPRRSARPAATTPARSPAATSAPRRGVRAPAAPTADVGRFASAPPSHPTRDAGAPPDAVPPAGRAEHPTAPPSARLRRIAELRPRAGSREAGQRRSAAEDHRSGGPAAAYLRRPAAVGRVPTSRRPAPLRPAAEPGRIPRPGAGVRGVPTSRRPAPLRRGAERRVAAPTAAPRPRAADRRRAVGPAAPAAPSQRPPNRARPTDQQRAAALRRAEFRRRAALQRSTAGQAPASPAPATTPSQ